MKKRMLVLAVVVAFVLALPAYAAEQRSAMVLPTLSFNGTEATCKVQINGNSSTDSISATIKLLENGSCLETWTVTETGYVSFKDTVKVSTGKTYKLTVDAVIAGKPMSTAYVEKKCS